MYFVHFGGGCSICMYLNSVGDGYWVIIVIGNEKHTLFEAIIELHCTPACFTEEIHFLKVGLLRGSC